ncbi:hypothetical protein JCM17960_29210 [Magnetospira thiophila]
MTRTGELRGWALIAVGTLGLAGLLALLLAFSRTPYVQDWLPWPWESFFYKALVTHVVFSTVAWFLSLLALVSAEGGYDRRAPRWSSRLGLALAALGCGFLLIPALFNLGDASLNDYVPLIDHPLFGVGLVLFAAGVAVPVLRLMMQPARWDVPLMSLGGIFLLALLTFALAAWRLPPDLDPALYWQRLFWGGGHLLQLLNTGLLILAWNRLCLLSTAQPVLGPISFNTVFILLFTVSLAGPAYTLLFDPMGIAYREAFTLLLWSGLVLPPSLVVFGLLRRMRVSAAWAWAAEGPALMLTLALFVVGGVLGYGLGVADTRTPAHYHAVIGAVNLAFMAWFLVHLPTLLNRPPVGRRWIRRMSWAYGIGQLLHAAGLFAAGSTGVPRKTAGLEQGLDTMAKKAAMGVAGVGGLLAVIGGILFIWLAARMLFSKERRP